MFAVVLTDVGLFATCVGLVGLTKPLRFAGLRTRVHALVLATAGVLVTIIGLTLPAPLSAVTHPRTALDRVTPEYQFKEVHTVDVRASPQQVYRAIKAITPGEILWFRTLIWVRRFGRPLPEGILNAPAHRPLLDVATATTFATLADSPEEIVIGTVVIPAPDARTARLTADEFRDLRSRPGFALAAMNFTIRPLDDGTCVVSTETRVYATNAAARRRFAAYWRIIYPGSALIRRMWLRAIRQRAERAATAAVTLRALTASR